MERRLNLAFVDRLSQQSVEEALKTCKKKAWQEEAKSKAMKGVHFRIEKLEESYQAKAMEHGVAGSPQSATKIASRRRKAAATQTCRSQAHLLAERKPSQSGSKMEQTEKN